MLGISTTNLRVNGFRGLSFVKKIIAAFKARVLADSGTFEAESCLTTTVQDLVNSNLYDSASLIVTPNAVKSGKIYALKGTDLTFTRASVANRTNSVGVLESMATGVPRIEYPIGGGCPSILLEPQRTNLFLNSFAPVTQSITVVNGSIYTVSINGGTATLSDAGTGSATTGSNRTFTATSTSLTITITGSPTWCQVEQGSFATSPIITTGAAVTRIVDTYTQTLTAIAAGTLYFNLTNNIENIPNAGVHLRGPVALNIGGAGLGVVTGRSSNTRVRIWTMSSGLIYTTTSNECKVAITFDGTNLNIWENGVKVVTNYAYAMSNVTRLYNDSNIDTAYNLKGINLYTSVLSDSQLAALTT